MKALSIKDFQHIDLQLSRIAVMLTTILNELDRCLGKVEMDSSIYKKITKILLKVAESRTNVLAAGSNVSKDIFHPQIGNPINGKAEILKFASKEDIENYRKQLQEELSKVSIDDLTIIYLINEGTSPKSFVRQMVD